MAFTIYEGLPGSGKSYTVVNDEISRVLRRSKRPIYHSLGIIDEVFVASLTRDPLERGQMLQRLHLLEDRDEIPRNPDGSERVDENDVPLGKRNMLREFWCFVETGAYIVLEESAEVHGTDKRLSRPELAQNFINRQRHFGLDLVFVCQAYADLDPVFRRKAHYVLTVENSLRLAMFDVALLSGIKWPVQFFILHEYYGPEFEKSGKSGRWQDRWFVRPNPAGFRNYRSRTATMRLNWLKPADDSETGDLKSRKTRFRQFVRQWRGPGLLALVLGAVVFGGYQGLMALLHVSGKASRGELLTRDTFFAGGTNSPAADEMNETTTTNATVTAKPEVERVLLATPSGIRTTEGFYAVGTMVGSNRIARVLLDGVELEGGRRVSFAVLFRGDGSQSR